MPIVAQLDIDDGSPHVTLTPTGDAAARDRAVIGVVVDGSHVASLPVGGAEPPSRIKLRLPRDRIAVSLDLIDEATGRSVLLEPHALAAHYAIAFTQLAAANGGVFGRFSARNLDPRLWIEFILADGRRVAGGLANRDPDDANAPYVFALPFIAAVPLGEPIVMLPVVAGSPRPEAAVSLTPAEIGMVGYVDVAVPGRVSGWAADLVRPAHRLEVSLVGEGGVVIASTIADQPRDDVRALGIGDGHCAFAFALTPDGMVRAPRSLAVVAGASRVALCGSPVTALPASTVRGCLDTLHGLSAHGWALDDADPTTPLVVEAVCDGRVLAQAEAKLFRGDLLEAGLNEGFCAFKIAIGTQLIDLVGRDIYVRVQGTDKALQGSPIQATHNPNERRYLRTDRDVASAVLPRLTRMMNHRVGSARLSIVMPVYNTPRVWLIEALASVRRQWCEQWTLICVDDRSTEPHVAEVLRAHAAHDPRIVVLTSPANVGIAAAVNFGLRAATGDYVAFMDHDDILEPDAVYHLLRAARDTDADVIYSDEATTDESIDSILEVRARPSFSYDYYLSHPYFVHMICVRRALAHQVGGWDTALPISADVDFVLRLFEHAARVAHVPRVLYRWRTHDSSTGHAKQSAVMEATCGAIQRHLDRRATGATVRPGVWFNQFRVDWPAQGGRVLVVIPTKNRADLLRVAIESIERTAAGCDVRIVVVDHQSDEPASRAYLRSLKRRHVVMSYRGRFNYSRMNNQAVERHGAGCDFVLFLNNDIEALEAGWLDRMRRLAARLEVGAVGALLLYPDRRVQHAGVILGFNGSADHAFKFEDAYLDDRGRRNLGYNCSLSSTRDFSAVTAACLMMRTELFRAVGGFDEVFGVGFNDTDLCLRLRERGLKVLYDGSSVLLHYESATRSQTREILHPEDTARLLDRHADILAGGDPFYNPNLSLVTQDHVLRADSGCKQFRNRVTVLAPPDAALAAGAELEPGVEVEVVARVPAARRRA